MFLLAAKVRRTAFWTARSGNGGAQIMKRFYKLTMHVALSLHCVHPKACVIGFTIWTRFISHFPLSEDILSSPFSCLPTNMAKEFLHQLLKLENSVKSDKPQPCIIVRFPSLFPMLFVEATSLQN